jgi:hypothetical protein
VSFWLASVLPAVLFTAAALALHRASRDPKTSRADAVPVDLCLGLTGAVASVLWLRVLATLLF